MHCMNLVFMNMKHDQKITKSFLTVHTHFHYNNSSSIITNQQQTAHLLLVATYRTKPIIHLSKTINKTTSWNLKSTKQYPPRITLHYPTSSAHPPQHGNPSVKVNNELSLPASSKQPSNRPPSFPRHLHPKMSSLS